MKDVSSIFQIPSLLVFLNFYANNNVTASTTDNHATSTLLNINFLGQYTSNIKTGETKIIYKDVNSYNLLGLDYERSFDSSGIATTTLKGDYTIFLELTPLAFSFIWIMINIPISYAFILIISSCLKFVLFGYPFIDLKDFKDKRNIEKSK